MPFVFPVVCDSPCAILKYLELWVWSGGRLHDIDVTDGVEREDRANAQCAHDSTLTRCSLYGPLSRTGLL